MRQFAVRKKKASTHSWYQCIHTAEKEYWNRSVSIYIKILIFWTTLVHTFLKRLFPWFFQYLRDDEEGISKRLHTQLGPTLYFGLMFNQSISQSHLERTTPSHNTTCKQREDEKTSTIHLRNVTIPLKQLMEMLTRYPKRQYILSLAMKVFKEYENLYAYML